MSETALATTLVGDGPVNPPSVAVNGVGDDGDGVAVSHERRWRYTSLRQGLPRIDEAQQLSIALVAPEWPLTASWVNCESISYAVVLMDARLSESSLRTLGAVQEKLVSNVSEELPLEVSSELESESEVLPESLLGFPFALPALPSRTCPRTRLACLIVFVVRYAAYTKTAIRT